MKLSQCLKKGLKPFCKVPFDHSVHTEVNGKQIFSERFFASFRSTKPLGCTCKYNQLLRCSNNLFKESLKFFAIIAAENKTDTRIYGTIS